MDVLIDNELNDEGGEEGGESDIGSKGLNESSLIILEDSIILENSATLEESTFWLSFLRLAIINGSN